MFTTVSLRHRLLQACGGCNKCSSWCCLAFSWMLFRVSNPHLLSNSCFPSSNLFFLSTTKPGNSSAPYDTSKEEHHVSRKITLNFCLFFSHIKEHNKALLTSSCLWNVNVLTSSLSTQKEGSHGMGGAVVPKNRNFSVWSLEASEIKSKEIILTATSFVLVNFNNIAGQKTKRYNDRRKNNGKLINVLCGIY